MNTPTMPDAERQRKDDVSDLLFAAMRAGLIDGDPALRMSWDRLSRWADGDAAPEPEAAQDKCRAVKHGGTTLLCGKPADHGESWHKAIYTESREVVYDGSRHMIQMTETVTWEPVDHVKEATRHIMAGRKGTE